MSGAPCRVLTLEADAGLDLMERDLNLLHRKLDEFERELAGYYPRTALLHRAAGAARYSGRNDEPA